MSPPETGTEFQPRLCGCGARKPAAAPRHPPRCRGMSVPCIWAFKSQPSSRTRRVPSHTSPQRLCCMGQGRGCFAGKGSAAAAEPQGAGVWAQQSVIYLREEPRGIWRGKKMARS